jgi:putative OmpL-like beta-barrel porin-2
MRRFLVVALSLGAAMAPGVVSAQMSSVQTEIEAIKQEMRKLQERLQRLEQGQAAPGTPVAPAAAAPAVSPAPPVVAQPAPAVGGQPGERPGTLEKETPLEALGGPKLEIGGVRIHGFAVGSFSYNSHIQMVPEFAGGGQALADPGSTNFRFDKFSLGISKTFAPWLSAGATMEVESHRDRHTHLIPVSETANRRDCPVGVACERFGAEEPETEVNLDAFYLTAIVPIGNGLALSFGRFDTPYGMERHDEPFNLTATTSEIFQFGKPMKYTGFQGAYQLAPWADAVAWVANRWESDTTHDPFDDNNKGKSFGGRVGFTPISGPGQLNFGVGGWFGPEQDDSSSRNRWIIDVDATWSPLPRLLLAAEFLYGNEDKVSFRERGLPFPQPAAEDLDVSWWGFSLLAHYDVASWLGLSLRYGYFDDMDGARTGVRQVLQSFTLAPIIHLSRLIPDLRPMGVTYARTTHPIDWVNLKVEYRLNHSNRSAFSDSVPNIAITGADEWSHQFQLQIVVNF